MRRVCVFAGANVGKDPAFLEAAKALGAALGKRSLGMVYGGTSIGLMGACADAALAAGSEVQGVLPRLLTGREIAHKNITELRIVPSLSERKQVMCALSDAFVALPGGFGTLDELFEVVTMRQLSQLEAPVGVLDVNGYYEKLLAFLDHGAALGLMSEPLLRSIVVRTSADALLDAMTL
ncbi:MAG: TIGR00730 family Rossman fold protein [Deltaproteobacteria bacterium]|nr:TIGR00730 family Rossman fold protein [Deltaproteobacteria bacterium]